MTKIKVTGGDSWLTSIAIDPYFKMTDTGIEFRIRRFDDIQDEEVSTVTVGMSLVVFAQGAEAQKAEILSQLGLTEIQ